jgi:peptidoglycan hydrolase-like protein with peptidoglycan-binding domain
VTRTDLTTTVSVPGKLGFGPTRKIKGSAGTVTWLPQVGAVVERGQLLYRRNDRAVPLLFGSTPLFRNLDTPGMVGRDVRVLVDNLKALGYQIGAQPRPGQTVNAPAGEPGAAAAGTAGSGTTGAAGAAGSGSTATMPGPGSSPPGQSTGGTVAVKVAEGDGVLTSGLIAAVRRWQAAYGAPATGVVGAGDVVVHSGALRVASLAAQPGDPADGPLMAVTGTAKAITVLLSAGEARSVQHGDAVTVTLPDGQAAPAKVTEVGTEAQSSENSDAEPRIVVTISLDNAGAVEHLDAAPVKVDVLGRTSKNVLAVPVGALLAVLEGGYAVQIVGGPVVPVQAGLFANGQVEVTGPGIAEGVAVVTTS